MDSRVIFFFTFFFTFFGTILVAVVSVYTEQDWIDTAIYSVSAMWVLGISSQILFQNVYRTIILPLEEEKVEALRKLEREEGNLRDIEAISQDANRGGEGSNQVDKSEIPDPKEALKNITFSSGDAFSNKESNNKELTK